VPDDANKLLGPDPLTRRSVVDQLALKFNNADCKEPCALCGRLTHPQVGWEVFLRDSFDPVCDDCARHHAPGLIEARHAANQAWAQEEEREARA
jgi:hypothetical protein